MYMCIHINHENKKYIMKAYKCIYSHRHRRIYVHTCTCVARDITVVSEVVAAIARWLGTVGAVLMDTGTPDVQARVEKVVIPPRWDGTASAQHLELTKIPAAADRHGWEPRVLHREQANVIVGRGMSLSS